MNNIFKKQIYDEACFAASNYEAIMNNDKEVIEQYGDEVINGIAQEMYEKLINIVDNWEELMNDE